MKRTFMFLAPIAVIFLSVMIYGTVVDFGLDDVILLYAIPLLVWIAISIYFYIYDRREFLTSVFSTIIFLLILLLLGIIF